MDVFDMRYMKRIRLTLRCIGGWPNHMFEDVPASKLSVISRYGYTCLLCTLCCFAIVAQITYLRKNMETLKFIDLGQTYLTILMSFVYLGESLVDAVYQVPWECMDTGNRRTVLILLQIVQQTLSVKACGMVPVGVQTMLATYNRVNKLCEMATIIQHIQLFTSALMFNIGPIYSNYKSGMFSSDEPVNANKMDVFDMRYMKRIRLTLRCIGGWPNHMFEDVPASKLSVISRYGYTCLLCTLCCFAIVAQITYLRKNMETLKFIDLGQTYLTILMSFVYLGESLVDAVYQVPWECMDTGNRRTVLILLQIVQQTLSVKACGMVPVGVQTMLACMAKSCFRRSSCYKTVNHIKIWLYKFFGHPLLFLNRRSDYVHDEEHGKTGIHRFGPNMLEYFDVPRIYRNKEHRCQSKQVIKRESRNLLQNFI
ncbi:hypothetical protein MSG28_012863 [Choristoneura fumiferana]|uniref:Uncharacterized protein n=1 Tax=Choristoneura fumiferana TaxID=7141 RepID=A0ACC0JIB4_CHOFU|nr:hypothetical protein MSG28_012863 [Choristoneura fumiferana]